MSQHTGPISSPCPECEFILDIYFTGDLTHVWTKTKSGETKHYPLFYHPRIYIAADGAADQYAGQDDRSLRQLLPLVSSHPGIVSWQVVDRYLSSSHDRSTRVIEGEVFSPHRLDEVVSDLQAHNINLFNIDLNKRQQFFVDTASTPMVACHLHLREPTVLPDYKIPAGGVELERITVHDDPVATYYHIPTLRIMDIVPVIDQADTFPQYSDPLAAVDLTLWYFDKEEEDRSLRLAGDERQILLELIEHVEWFDPDFLNIINGDKFVLNYLAHRAKYHHITSQFVLGRLDRPLYPRSESKGQAYMSYGQIMRREQVWYLPGRVHIDAENSFFMHEAGLAGLIDLSRMSGVPPVRTSRSSIGTALTGIEFLVNSASIPPSLVPPKKATGEQFKAADHLLISDNGGLIYPAQPGVYTGVWAVDFTSLYPLIMAIHNISSETVLCLHESCRRDDPIIVPEVDYHICRRKIGVVPRTMYLVLQKRLQLKMAKRKDLPEVTKNRFKGIDSAMKWILVSCFGYLGFKNARWGSIESHQCVTAYARRYLLQARQICEDFGFRVIAGITDSLFIQAIDPKDDTPEQVEHLVREVSKQCSIPLDTEGRFQWVVFCNVRDYTTVAALNRYFGYFDHGEFKLRGIKHRQRRAAPAERKFQEDILDILKSATTLDQFRELIPIANQKLIWWKEQLKARKVRPQELVIKLKSGRGVDGYRTKTTIQALTAQKYKEQGKTIMPGQNFYYLVSNDDLKTTDRLIIGPNVTDNSEYDAEFYCKLLEDDFQELVEAPQRQFFGKIKYTGHPDGELTELDDFFEEDHEFPSFSKLPTLDDYF